MSLYLLTWRQLLLPKAVSKVSGEDLSRLMLEAAKRIPKVKTAVWSTRHPDRAEDAPK